MLAAEHCDAFHVNFMARQARGLVCLALTRDRCEQLELTSMVIGGSNKKPNFTTSIEAAKGIDTGISADRAHTIQTAIASFASPADIVQPGHVFPLMVASGGVLCGLVLQKPHRIMLVYQGLLRGCYIRYSFI